MLNRLEDELKVLKVVNKKKYKIGKREVAKIRTYIEEGHQPKEVQKLM